MNFGKETKSKKIFVQIFYFFELGSNKQAKISLISCSTTRKKKEAAQATTTA
jgi:hypothetical protein